jgi:RimJ/RimL family protein N-acetyltransferase
MARVSPGYTVASVRTERLLLRPYEPPDLDGILAIYSQPEVVRYLYEGPFSREGAAALLERKIANRHIRSDGDAVSFGVEISGSGPVIGDCMVRLLSDAHRQGEIGFVIHPDHQGRGYATEAGRALLRIGFDDLELHRVIGRLEARNAASARVLKKLGMRREAHLIENEWVKDEWQSELIYAALDREWRATSVGSERRTKERTSRTQARQTGFPQGL